MKPYSKNQVHYNWHWFCDTGNGDMGNLGVHALDLARMVLDLSDYPEKVQSMGGSAIFVGAKETPTFQTAAFQYRGRKVLLEYSVRNGYTNTEAGVGESIPFLLGDRRDGYGLVVFGSEGYMVIPDYNSYRTYLGRDRRPGPARIGVGPPDSAEPHLRNFLNAMRSRREADLSAGVDVAVRSAAMCHLANIAYRVRETLTVDPSIGRILGNRSAEALKEAELAAQATGAQHCSRRFEDVLAPGIDVWTAAAVASDGSMAHARISLYIIPGTIPGLLLQSSDHVE